MVAITRRAVLQGMGGLAAVAWLGCGDGDAEPSADAAPASPDAASAPLDAASTSPDAASTSPDAASTSPDAVPDAAPVGLTGRVVRPGDPDYDAARADWNGRFSISPQAIVFAASVDDVVNAIRFARQNGVALRPRSGRHSFEAYSLVENGLVLDVSGLHDVAVDTGSGVAHVGAGADLRSIYDALGAAGVTIPGGSCASLGIAGLVLGGGYGLISRKYGLTCDRLVSVDLVDATGQLIHASADENSDLYWALRGGGGGNFGVATAFELSLVPTTDVAIYSASWPIESFAAVFAAWQSWAPTTDRGLVSTLHLGPRKVTSLGQFLGSASDLETLLAPLTTAATPTSLTVSPMSYLDAVHFFGDDTADMRPKFKNGSTYALAALPDDAVAVLLAQIAATPEAGNLIQMDAMGGAIADVAVTDTAFPWRQALYSIQVKSGWTDDADAAANQAWVSATRAALAPYTSGAYVNYVDADVTDYAQAYYGANLTRLSSVKRAVDPDGFFAFPQAIPG